MSDRLQRDVIRKSRAPVLASHSYARSLFNVSRNIPDDIIKQISKKGGAVMVSFDSAMLSSRKHFSSKRKAPIETLINHIDHIVRIAGSDHVGIGSDFEGSGENSPLGLETATGFSLITYHLLKKGYSKKDIHKILGGNLLRIMQKVEILRDH
jgi:membrane dipeptidase